VALNKPTWEEKGQWLFQRFVSELPTSGEMVFYDRSWYRRTRFERLMGVCAPRDYL
jgi:polyphosphate kinase 2 (PPK2 family)